MINALFPASSTLANTVGNPKSLPSFAQAALRSGAVELVVGGSNAVEQYTQTRSDALRTDPVGVLSLETDTVETKTNYQLWPPTDPVEGVLYRYANRDLIANNGKQGTDAAFRVQLKPQQKFAVVLSGADTEAFLKEEGPERWSRNVQNPLALTADVMEYVKRHNYTDAQGNAVSVKELATAPTTPPHATEATALEGSTAATAADKNQWQGKHKRLHYWA